MADDKRRALTTAALGRPFQLGMLYDCRTNTLITGLSLWDHKILNPKHPDTIVHSKRMENSSIHLITEDSLESKAKHLGISGEAKLGIMSGDINISGSAEYLSDTKSSSKCSRVSLHYQSTSEFREVDFALEQLKEERHKAVELKFATHVVTGIVYGADAVFVFDHMMDENSSKDKLKVEGDMKMALSTFTLDVKGAVNLDADQESMKDKMSCKFYGDVILEKLPTFSNNAPCVVRSISDTMVAKVQETIEEFQHLKVKATDLKKTYNFPPFSDYIHRQLDLAVSILDNRQRKLTTGMREWLPRIRGEDDVDESKLQTLIDDNNTAPFDLQHMKQWLEAKENEAGTMEGLFKLVDDIDVDPKYAPGIEVLTVT